MMRRIVTVVVLALSFACTDKPSQAPNATAATQPAASAASQPASRPGTGPATAIRALGPQGQLNTSPEDRCPVCAMKPHKHPKFAAGVELNDGRSFYTCGTGCYLRVHLHPEIYFGAAKIKRAFVPNYFDGKPIESQAAWWVAGSDVVGAMGPTPVALSSKDDSDSFVRRHGGAHRFRLQELDDAKFQTITGKPAIKAH